VQAVCQTGDTPHLSRMV